MKWEVVEDYESLSLRAADILLSRVESHPSTVFGLPTGRTPEGMYSRVVAACRRGYRCFRHASTFNLDEYIGIPRSHPGSYFTYMKQHLFDHVDLDSSNQHLPDGLAEAIRAADPSLDFESALLRECAAYEAKITGAGGLDLTLLGMGTNGHIGFNEPGTRFDSRTRVVTLAASTRQANSAFFPDGVVPERAITMGIGTILESKAIVLLANGSRKAEGIKRLASAPPSPESPASALAAHADVTVIVDRSAAALL